MSVPISAGRSFAVRPAPGVMSKKPCVAATGSQTLGDLERYVCDRRARHVDMREYAGQHGLQRRDLGPHCVPGRTDQTNHIRLHGHDAAQQLADRQ